MQCPSCGASRNTGMRFCTRCGYDFAGAAETRDPFKTEVMQSPSCPGCKAIVPIGAAFCAACGTPLNPGASTGPVADRGTMRELGASGGLGNTTPASYGDRRDDSKTMFELPSYPPNMAQGGSHNYPPSSPQSSSPNYPPPSPQSSGVNYPPTTVINSAAGYPPANAYTGGQSHSINPGTGSTPAPAALSSKQVKIAAIITGVLIIGGVVAYLISMNSGGYYDYDSYRPSYSSPTVTNSNRNRNGNYGYSTGINSNRSSSPYPSYSNSNTPRYPSYSNSNASRYPSYSNSNRY